VPPGRHDTTHLGHGAGPHRDELQRTSIEKAPSKEVSSNGRTRASPCSKLIRGSLFVGACELHETFCQVDAW